MNKMKCLSCALKHISAALSYGKEILSGHGKGAELDHRPDFLGELINLEHHLEALNIDIYIQIKNYRQNLQEHEVFITFNDIDYLRQLYIRLQQSEQEIKQLESGFVDEDSCVLFLNIKNEDYFSYCYKKLKEHLSEYTDIYYLNSQIDMAKYDMKKINYSDIKTEYIFIMDEHYILLKKQSAKSLLRLADMKKDMDFHYIAKQIGHIQGAINYYENFPCLVKKDEFQPIVQKKYPLTIYCNKYKIFEIRAFTMGVYLDKKICCSNRQRLKSCMYAYVANEQALQSIKKQIN